MSILDDMGQAIVDGSTTRAVELAHQAIASGLEPLEALDAYTKGMKYVGEKFASGEYFLPELIMSGEAMKKAVEVLDAELKKRGQDRDRVAAVVVGTVEGDLHDIGKTIVASLLSASGFEVLDLGVDVKAGRFVEEARESGADVIGLSALLTTTLPQQGTVVESLKEAGLRNRAAVLVGGAPASQDWADEIGADGYGENAIEAVRLATRLVAEKT